MIPPPASFRPGIVPRLRDAAIMAQFALMAGGGAAFFLFARVLFDRVPGFSPHPRFDAGEVVAPVVYLSNMAQIVFSITIVLGTLARQFEPGVSLKTNRWVGAVALCILAIALVERIYLIPEIAGLRAAVGRSGFDDGVTSPGRARFGMLHGIQNATQLAAVLAAWTGLFLERSVRRG
jgi:hypothetical protein